MKKYIVYSIFSILLFSSCDDFFDQVVDVDVPEHTPSLAVTSSMTNTDTILWAYVTNSVGILVQDNPDAITDATVELYKNGSLLQSLPHINDGFYGWQIPEPLSNDGATYELKVEKEGFESVTGTQVMPPQIDIITASYEEDGTVDTDGERVDEFIVEFQDQKDVENYYKVEASLVYEDENGNQYNNDIYLDSFDPNYNYTEDGLYLSDLLFDGDQAEIRLYTYDLYYNEEYMKNAKILIRLVHLTKDKYFREVSVYNYDPENPFSEPTIIFSNIENGYGIFSLEATGPVFEIEL